MLFSLIQTSQAELWEFIIEADVENNIVHSGDTVIVTGTVVDQAYKSTRGVEILIRAGSETTKAFTSPDGTFRGEFTDFQRIPGTYIVNVIASWDGMTGMINTQFQVKGDTTVGRAIIERLSTDEAIKYLSSNESDFEKNPIGQTLFKYYHELHDELIKEKKKANKVDKKQILLNQQRTVAENLKNNALTKYNPKAGVYDGYQYEQYIHSLNPKIRDRIANQLNFTKSNFVDAQNIRDEILEKGGTYEEAKQAYLDRISISKEELNEFNGENQMTRQKRTSNPVKKSQRTIDNQQISFF
jgi:hypothetical protein